jgi:hypothetical protein
VLMAKGCDYAKRQHDAGDITQQIRHRNPPVAVVTLRRPQPLQMCAVGWNPLP